MNTIALVGAVIGAVVGAIIWAIVSGLTGYEVGWIAWGIGGLVGFGATILGGRGTAMGGACAVLALLAIFAGKVISYQVSFEEIARKEIAKGMAQAYSEEVFEELCADAEAFAQLLSEDEHREFMVHHRYTEAGTAIEVTDEEVLGFRQDSIPMLERLAVEKPSYEDWLDSEVDEAVKATVEHVSMIEIVKEDLGPIDLVFGFLGVATAFRVGSGLRRDETA